MQYFIEIPLSDGQTALAAVSDQADDVVPFGRGKDQIAQLAGSLADGLGRVRAFASDVLQGIRDVAEPPERVAIEFGLTLSAKAGMVIAETATEGHVTVTVEWSRPERDRPAQPAGS